MKRCPQCNRIETDDALAFCRADGTALINDSASISGEGNTAKFASGAVASEIETSILPDATASGRGQPTALTSVLEARRAASGTRELRSKRRKVAAFTIATVAVSVLAVSIYFYLSRNNETAIDSIAVLPFANQNRDPDTDYLSEGLAESLIYRLSQLPKLKVSPTSSVFRYKGKEIDPIKVGNDLGVRAVLSGRITQHGDSLTISAELVDVRNNKLLWGEQYDRKTLELLATQREIAREIVDNLRLKVSPQEKVLAKHYTESNEAYQNYLKGRFYWNKRNADALKNAIDYFNKAIQQDPNFALAYAGLADTYVNFPVYSVGSPQESFPKGKAAAQRALEIDDTLAEAHTSLAYLIFTYDWNFEESNKEFRRAIALNPNYATAHQWYGAHYLTGARRFDEAVAEGKQAISLDPLSLIINADLGATYIYARRYDQAVEQLRKTLELDQSFYYAHWRLGMAYALRGSFQEALAEYQKAKQLNDDPQVLALMGSAYAASGRKDEALKMLDQLKEISKRRYISAYSFALVYGALGEKDQAFQWLEQSYQNRDWQMARINVDPMFDNLRSDKRFTDLVRRIGLPQ